MNEPLWLVKFKDARVRAGNPPYRIIAEKAKCSERTVLRIFNGQYDSPSIYYLDGIATALHTSLKEIFADTDASFGNIDELKEQIKSLTEEVTRLTVENEALNSALKYKDEIIKLKDEIIKMHDNYNKMLSSN